MNFEISAHFSAVNLNCCQEIDLCTRTIQNFSKRWVSCNRVSAI